MTPLLFAALISCTTRPHPEPEPAPEPVAEEAEAEVPEAEEEAKPRPKWEVKKHMSMHFAFVTDALWFTFKGDIEGLQGEAKKLTEHEPIEDMPEEWGPFMDAMHARSKRLEEAKTIEEAAKGLVRLADACAGCHKANEGPKITQDDLMMDPDLFGEESMDRHEWAAWLMWIGLVVPSDDIWTSGIKVLAHPKGTLPDMPEEAKPLEMRVHDLSARAAGAATYKDRGAVFAELLTTCGECHTQLEVEFR